jgi:hypothetical protein
MKSDLSRSSFLFSRVVFYTIKNLITDRDRIHDLRPIRRRKGMTKYLVKWVKNEALMPQDPVMMAKLQLSLLEGAKADMKSGKITDWGSFNDASGGYFIAEGNESDIYNGILKYYPYISFDAKAVVSVDQVIESINKIMVEMKPK